jgi:hypothetical protein
MAAPYSLHFRNSVVTAVVSGMSREAALSAIGSAILR